MADNYLEKKMEEHRSGARPSYRPKLTPRGRKPGELLIEFQPCPVYIHDASTPLMRKLVAELAAVGFNVEFRYPDIHEGASFAKTAGAKFLPPNLPASLNAIQINATDGSIAIWRERSGITVAHTGLANADETAIKSVVWSATLLANFNDFDDKMLRNIKIQGYSL